MTPLEAHNDTHPLNIPLKARGHQTTTVGDLTQLNHSSDTNVSPDAACAVSASVPHHHMHSEASVNITDNFNSQFVGATPADDATVADAQTPATAAAVAFNSVNTAVTEAPVPREKVSSKTTNRELLVPRLCRESGGVAPTAQMTRVDGRKRAEVQGSAPSIKRGGRPCTSILEVGPCGFAFDINSIPDIARRA